MLRAVVLSDVAVTAGRGRARPARRHDRPFMLFSNGLKGVPRAISPRRLGLSLPALRAWHWLALAVCLASGAGLNLYRRAWRPAGDAQAYRGFYVPEGQVDGQTVRWSRAYSKAEVPLYAWRPLRWRVQLTAPPAAAPSGASTWILVNDARVQRVTVGSGWHTIEFVTDAPPARDLALQFYSTLYGPDELGIGVGRVTVEPAFTMWNVFQTGLLGALMGLLLWLVCLIRPDAPRERPDARPADKENNPSAPAPTTPRWRPARAMALLLLVWLYLGIWAVLKPPLQAPDEPQHLLRASSVRLQPWAAKTPDWLTLDPQFLNPLVLWPTENIGKLFFNSLKRLSMQDIAVLKATPWQTHLPALEPFRTPLATYPTTYYAAVFGLAEATTALLHLTPYQNIYAYRAWTVLFAGLLWLAVYGALRITPGAARHANALFAFLLLNPMLAFVSSSVTPDSVNVPLATLAVLLTYRTLVTGRAIWLAAAALIACGLTKPTIILLLGSMPLPMLLTWRAGTITVRQLIAGALAAARSGAIAFCVFYAWSPPRFLASAPMRITFATYAHYYLDRLPTIWRSYWGVLGWLDYELDTVWYVALLVLVITIAIVVRRRTPEEARFTRFTAWLGVSYFVLMTIGEYAYLPTMGYNFQGRHLLPACLAFSGLVLHGNAYARWTLLAFLALMNVMLMHATVVRYFNGDLACLWASLPLP
jgi:hypothetical protein